MRGKRKGKEEKRKIEMEWVENRGKMVNIHGQLIARDVHAIFENIRVFYVISSKLMGVM